MAARLRATAVEVESQAGARTGWSREALRQWRGNHADGFRADTRTAQADAAELAVALRGAAWQLDTLAERARDEQRRRERAAAWQAEQDRENALEKVAEKVFGTDERPPYLAVPPEPAPVVVQGPRVGGRAR